MSCAYLIANVDVTDAARYEGYRTLSTAAMRAHGAEICVRGGASELLEGKSLAQRTVVMKFESLAKARAFYDSPEYRLAREARDGACEMHMMLVEGV